MDKVTRYRALEQVVESLASLNASENDVLITILKLRQRAQEALRVKDQPRNSNLDQARTVAGQVNKRLAEEFRAKVLPKIEEAKSAGATGRREIAAWLNNSKVLTSRGGTWSAGSVHRFMISEE